MGYLHRNLDVLRDRNATLADRIDRCVPGPNIEYLEAASGAPTFRVGDSLEASSVDPEAEGRQLADHFLAIAQETGAERLVLFGMGVHTLRQLNRFEGKILAIEPSIELCRAVLERVDLTAFLGRFELLVTDDAGVALRHPLFTATERGAFVAHSTVKRRAGKLHDDLAKRFHAGGSASAFDIAVIPPLYGGTLPVAKACARALRELGHRVREIDLSAFFPAYEEVQRITSDPRLRGPSAALRQGLMCLIGETLVTSFHLDPPDLVFAVAQAPLDPITLDKLGQMGISRAFWFCEDFHVMPYWKDLAPNYDTFFHVQPGSFDEPLREAGGFGFPLPIATDPAVHRPLDLTPEQQQRYECGISFVGAGYHNRRVFLPGLFDLGLRIYGTEWPVTPPYAAAMPEPNVRQSTEASNLIFNATRINLNLHSSPWCDGVNPAGDYLNPRTFELASARAFQLVDERADLSQSFKRGEEIETFRDAEECRKKITYYLAHEDERREIAEAGYRRALAEHTYRHRMEVALDVLRAAPRPLIPRRKPLPTVGALLDEAKDEPGLRQIFERLSPDEIVNNTAITQAVLRGDGSLTEDEQILLYMREALSELEFMSEIGLGQ